MNTKNKLSLLAFGGALFCLFAFKGPGNGKTKEASLTTREDKVLLCHNGHDIMVSQNALATHLGHGDALGSCDQPADPCEACASAYVSCLESAGGDPDVIKLCAGQYKTCLTNAGCSGPAAPPAGGK